MSDPILSTLKPRELRQLRNHAMRSQDAGLGGECSLEAAAASLLRAHLLLMRDCANVMPANRQVSLGGRSQC